MLEMTSRKTTTDVDQSKLSAKSTPIICSGKWFEWNNSAYM